MLGQRCLVARVEAGGPGGRMRLASVAEGTAADLRAWRDKKLFKGSQTVLVLRSDERQFLTIDKPDVPDVDLQKAVRWPLAEALETEAEQLLTTALLLPPINPALHPQVLAVAGRLELVRGHLAALDEAGIKARSIDVTDSALRGMALLNSRSRNDALGNAMSGANDGWVVLAFIGSDVCIGLLWHGEFCALRTLSLPVRQPRNESEFEEHLALHIQRTVDHFERQATQLSIRHVLASMPSLSVAARESVRASLPLSATLFELEAVFDMSGATLEHCEGDDDLTALACVAAARLVDGQLGQAAAAASSGAAPSTHGPSTQSPLPVLTAEVAS